MAKKKEYHIEVSYKPKSNEVFNAQDDNMNKYVDAHHGEIGGTGFGFGGFRDYSVYFKSIQSAHNFIKKIKKVYKRRLQVYTDFIE